MLSDPRSLGSRLARALLFLGAASLAWDHLTEEGQAPTVVQVTDEQVLVVLDRLTGQYECDERPGTHVLRPGLEEGHVLERRTLRYVMGASDGGEDLAVAPLVVRGADGANFAFDAVEIQLGLDPLRADVALVDHGGTPDAALRLADAYARPALRAAFGRFTPTSVVLPENKQSGTQLAAEDLGRSLERHGLRLLELSVSRPRFAPKFQETVQRRKVAEQDLERLSRERAERASASEEELLELRLQMEREAVLQERALEEAWRIAQNAAADLRAQTDLEVGEGRATAELARDQALARAALESEKHRSDAAAFRLRLESAAKLGDASVRAALVKRLDSMRFDLGPAPLAAGQPASYRDVH